MSDEVVRFEASFILAPGWSLPREARPAPAGKYRLFIVDEVPSVTATLSKPQWHPKDAVFRRDDGTSLMVRLVEIQAINNPGCVLEVAIRTRDVEVASAFRRGDRGLLSFVLEDRATGEMRLYDQMPPLEVTAVVPMGATSAASASIRLAAAAEPEGREPGPPPTPTAPDASLPFRGVVIRRNDLGDGWMAEFAGFTKAESPLQVCRGTARSVGQDVWDVMRRLP